MIEEKLEHLKEMSMAEIKKQFSHYFNCHAGNYSKDFYIANIAYRMQELEFGGLSSATKNLLVKMHTTVSAPKKKNIAPVGTKIIKTYKGHDYVVRILEDGFDLDGQRFKTLSGMAKKITGMKISGNVFFNIGQRGK